MPAASTDLPIAVPDPLVAPLRDREYLVELISTISGSDPDTVRRRLAQEESEIGSNVRRSLEQFGVEPYKWSDRLVEFYSSTDAFLYETLVWNRSPIKNQMRRWIAEFLARRSARPLRVLTYGDGLGFDSLYLAQCGHQVSYFEVSRDCLAFAQRIFADQSAQVDVLTTPESVPAEHFDAVVCLDVLEHVPDPPAVVRQLAAALRPGGLLIAHAPFWFIHPAVSTHLISNRKYSGDVRRLYRAQGLRPIDAEWFWNPIVSEKTGGAAPQRLGFGPRLRLALGGMLLKVARYWALPFILGARVLAALQSSKTGETKPTRSAG